MTEPKKASKSKAVKAKPEPVENEPEIDGWVKVERSKLASREKWITALHSAYEEIREHWVSLSVADSFESALYRYRDLWENYNAGNALSEDWWTPDNLQKIFDEKLRPLTREDVKEIFREEIASALAKLSESDAPEEKS